MGERGVAVDHTTLNRWASSYVSECEKALRHRQRPAGRSWRLNETDVKMKGPWASLDRAGDKEGHAVHCLVTPTCDRGATAAFFRQAVRHQELPQKITTDQSGAHTATITRDNKTHTAAVGILHSQYLDNILTQNHRAVKRRSRPLGCQSFWVARRMIAGIAARHTLREGRLVSTRARAPNAGGQFSAPAVEITESAGFIRLYRKRATDPSLPSRRT